MCEQCHLQCPVLLLLHHGYWCSTLFSPVLIPRRLCPQGETDDHLGLQQKTGYEFCFWHRLWVCTHLEVYVLSIVGFEWHRVYFYQGLDFNFLYVTCAYEIGLCSCIKFKRHNCSIDLQWHNPFVLRHEVHIWIISFICFVLLLNRFCISVDHAHKESVWYFCLFHKMHICWLLCLFLWKTLLSKMVHAFAFCTLLSKCWALFRLMLWTTYFTAKCIFACPWSSFLTLPFHFVSNSGDDWTVSNSGVFFITESSRMQ